MSGHVCEQSNLEQSNKEDWTVERKRTGVTVVHGVHGSEELGDREGVQRWVIVSYGLVAEVLESGWWVDVSVWRWIV